MSRNGKIARLPFTVRDELNDRLDDNKEGAEILEWLNSLPETRAVLEKSFAGVPISKQNLSEWRLGGYREWRIRRDVLEQAQELEECGKELAQSVDIDSMAGTLAAVLATRYAKVLLHWKEEPDATAEAELKMLRSLCRDIALLQKTLHQDLVQETEWERREEEQLQKDLESAKKKAAAPFFAALDAESVAALFGGGEAAHEAADFINALRYDMPLPKLDKLLALSKSQSNLVKPVSRKTEGKE